MRGSERPFLCGSVGILHVILTPGSGVILHVVVWYVRVVPVVFTRGSGARLLCIF